MYLAIVADCKMIEIMVRFPLNLNFNEHYRYLPKLTKPITITRQYQIQ